MKSPLYDWKAMEKEGYTWWIRRIRRAQDLYDEFRIDHFRGLAGFWAVPSGESTLSLFQLFARCDVSITCVCSINVQKQK